MTPETVQSPEPEPASMGAFSRIAGVFFEPGKTFEDIGRRPSWFLPLLLTILAGLAFYAVYGQRVGFERYLQQQLTTNPRLQQQIEQIAPERRQEALARQARMTGIGFYVGPFVGIPLMMVISSGLTLLVTSMMGAGLKFKQVFAVAAFAGLPMAIKHLLAIVVVFLKNPDDFNLMNPLAFNVAAFMDPLATSKFLYTFALAFDLFAIWAIVLTAIGLSAAAGKKRLSFGRALFAVLLVTLAGVTFGASMAAMFS